MILFFRWTTEFTFTSFNTEHETNLCESCNMRISSNILYSVIKATIDGIVGSKVGGVERKTWSVGQCFSFAWWGFRLAIPNSHPYVSIYVYNWR